MERYNHLDEAQRHTLHIEVVSSAKALREKSAPFIDCVRRLASLRFNITEAENDPDFTVFVAIDSETDHIPSSGIRSRFSLKWLEQCDRELEEFEKFYESDISAACEKIIERFSKL